jgi:hypothetical protein
MTSELDDAARWREFAALAREIFDRGDAWAAEQPAPEGVPVLFEGAEGWATVPLRAACAKGRGALERGDVAKIVLALVETGHAGRSPEIVKRWVRTLEAVGKERRRRATATSTARKDERDRGLLERLAEAPAAHRSTPNAAARWLRANGHTGLSHRHVVRRLRKRWSALETNVTSL